MLRHLIHQQIPDPVEYILVNRKEIVGFLQTYTNLFYFKAIFIFLTERFFFLNFNPKREWWWGQNTKEFSKIYNNKKVKKLKI